MFSLKIPRCYLAQALEYLWRDAEVFYAVGLCLIYSLSKFMLSTYYMPGIVLLCTLYSFNPQLYHYPYFAYKKTEAQRG